MCRRWAARAPQQVRGAAEQAGGKAITKCSQGIGGHICCMVFTCCMVIPVPVGFTPAMVGVMTLGQGRTVVCGVDAGGLLLLARLFLALGVEGWLFLRSMQLL